MTKPLSRSTLSSDAYATVRAILLDGERHAPGDKISVEALAQELGVSRSPLWAAISRLEAEGLVEVRPRQGVFMPAFRADEVRDIARAREALEGMVARRAAAQADEAQIAVMADSIDRQAQAIAAQDRAGYASANQHFHEALLAAAGSPTLSRLLHALYGQMMAMCGRRPFSFDQLARNRGEHVAVLDAIRRRDGDRADAMARQHVNSLVQALLAAGD